MRIYEFTNIKERYRDFSPTKSDAMAAQAPVAIYKSMINPKRTPPLEMKVIVNKKLQDIMAKKEKLAKNMSKTAGVKYVEQPKSFLPKPLSNVDGTDDMGELGGTGDYSPVPGTGNVKKGTGKTNFTSGGNQRYNAIENVGEGYYELPKMDKDKYQQRDGLEGPMMTKSGKVLYYDPKEGKYYDPDTDMYMDYEDAKALDEQMSPEQKSYRDSYNTARKDAINNYITNPQSKDLNMHINRSMLKWKRDYALGKDGTGTATINKGVVTKTEEITLEDTQDFHEEYGYLGYSIDETDMFEGEYQGRKVKLNKPMRGDVKKFKVYVKNKKGNVIKVNFGHGGTSAKRPTMRIRKSNPAARRSFRARHNCDNPGPKTKARYWSCRKW